MQFKTLSDNQTEAVNFLSSSDPILNKIIVAHQLLPPLAEQEVYLALLKSILSQQLSVKVASIITDRFLSIFPENDPKPDLILSTTDEKLRELGLSWQKISYVKNVAAFKADGKLEHDEVSRLADEELIVHLCQIKGVGRWTAEMILIFSLNRPNVFPSDDLGIQNAMKKHYGLTETGKELKKQMHEIAENWNPFCSFASRYLWLSLNNSK